MTGRINVEWACTVLGYSRQAYYKQVKSGDKLNFMGRVVY